jgi:4a-hydroxytetrahydrobiopterin dehydratase
VAQRVQSAARELGLRAEPAALRDVQLTFDALDVDAVRRFWAAALGYEARGETDLYDPLLRGPSVFLQPLDAPREQRNRIHVDVMVPADVADARVAAAVAAGGTVVRDAEAPFWRTVADPEGNEVDIAVVPGRAEAWGG